MLTSLPRTRPQRRSAKRPERPHASSRAAPADAAGTAPAAAAAEQPPPPGEAPRRKVPPAGYAAPGERDRRTERAPASPAVELVGTLVQAAGELAQIGAAIGRQTLREMVARLPRP